MITTFIRKQWSNILLLFFILILLVPQWRFPVQVGLQRVFSFAPSVGNKDDNIKALLQEWQLKRIGSDKAKVSPDLNTVTVINFWATWCPPCVAEMPSFQKLYDDYGDRIQFIFLSQEPSKVQSKFLREKGYNLPLYKTINTIPQGLDTQVLPTTFVLDKNGNIIVIETGSANWNASSFRQQLDKLLL